MQFEYPSASIKNLVDKISGLIKKSQTDCEQPRDDMTTMSKQDALKI